MANQLKVAIVTVSTRCSKGQAEDKSGPTLCDLAKSRNWTVMATAVVADEKNEIVDVLRFMISGREPNTVDVIFTTGGTGVSPDDLTPEATRMVLDRELPGLVSGMFVASYQETPFAMLSRAVAGVAGKTVVVNMPGSVRAVKTCFATVAPVLEHAVALLRSETEAVEKTHSRLAADKEGHEHHHHDHNQGHSHHHHHHGHGHSHQHAHSHDHGSSDDQRRRHGEDRPRQSPYPTVSVEKALEAILGYCSELPSEDISLPCCNSEHHATVTSSAASLHFRRASKDLFALCPVPSFRASVKDGYAVRSKDGAGQRLVIGRSDAGFCFSGGVLEPGYAVVINTGAKVPDSADAVVQIEDTRFVSGSSTSSSGLQVLETIEVTEAPKPGQDIRPVGSDLQVGEKLVSAGDRLHPAVVALLVSGGYSSVPAFKLPQIAVLSTGSELVSDLIPNEESGVRDSNRPMLVELLASHGFPSVDCGIAKDTVEDHRAKLTEALAIPDVRVVITTGGVSMGDCDFVKDVLQRDFGATIHFGRVFVKPGKPTVFATIERKDKPQETVLVFALPGNPVSALVTAHLFVLPALKRLAGERSIAITHSMFAKLEHDFDLDPRPEYHRVVLRSDPSSGILLATSTGLKRQASSRIASAAAVGADSAPLMLGAVALPPSSNERKVATAGSVLPVIPLSPI